MKWTQDQINDVWGETDVVRPYFPDRAYQACTLVLEARAELASVEKERDEAYEWKNQSAADFAREIQQLKSELKSAYEALDKNWVTHQEVISMRNERDAAVKAAQANGHTPVQSIQRLTDKLRASEEEAEQLRVQLAGCGVFDAPERRAKPGDYGWSSSYQQCMDVYDRLLDAQRDIVSWNASGLDFTDISSELERTYIYPKLEQVFVCNPVALHVSDSGGHRIHTEDGTSYYIKPGWLAIKWKVKPGQPNFVK